MSFYNNILSLDNIPSYERMYLRISSSPCEYINNDAVHQIPFHTTSLLSNHIYLFILKSLGNFHLKNLSMHEANNEEEALELLFIGDTNRAIAETPMNMVSL